MSARARFLLVLFLFLPTQAQAQFQAPPEYDPYPVPEEFSEQGVKRIPPFMPRYAAQSGHCDTEIEVGKDGRPARVDILRCTDSVFESETLKSNKLWTFLPEKAGEIIQQTTTFRLTNEDGELIPEADAAKFSTDDLPKTAKDAVLKQDMFPPDIPWAQIGKKIGYCCVDYSVSQIGLPFNVDVRACTNPNFKVTAETVVRWRIYDPATLGGRDVSVSDHQTSIDFYKLNEGIGLPRDLFGHTPVTNIQDSELGVCRPNS